MQVLGKSMIVIDMQKGVTQNKLKLHGSIKIVLFAIAFFYCAGYVYAGINNSIPSLVIGVEDLNPQLPENNKEALLSINKLSLHKLEGTISLSGYWFITLGVGSTLRYNPDESWLLDTNSLVDNLIFHQERLLSVEAHMNNALRFSLYSPEDINKTTFAIEYTPEKFLKRAFISNNEKEYTINKYRTLQTAEKAKT